jgi:hypothetical protein
MNPILSALGIETLPGPESETLKKILNDHLVCQRAQEFMIERFAAEAITHMHPVERAALLKRISPPPAVKANATWGIVPAYATQTGRVYVSTYCSACKNTLKFGEPEAQTQKVYGDSPRQIVGITEAALKKSLSHLEWYHCGHLDKAPPQIAAEWESYLRTLVGK